MLYDEYKGCIVRIELNQAACQGLDYVGRVKATDADFLRLGFYTRVSGRIGELDIAVERIERAEGGRRKEGTEFDQLINKLVIATLKPVYENTLKKKSTAL